MLARITRSVVKSACQESFLAHRILAASYVTGTPKIFTMNTISDIPGHRRVRKRVGRGRGSGLGKMSGYGHQKSRSTPRAFEGGQTPLYRRIPKFGFVNYTRRSFVVVKLGTLQEYIDMGRLVPKEKDLITIRDLYECGIVHNIQDGVKLLANGKEIFRTPIHLEVSYASGEAIKTIENAGGSVTCVHFNKLALRALVKPFKFRIYPLRARPSPQYMGYYLDGTRAGYLSPEVQLRNMKLFGYITSESRMREEHANFMSVYRSQLWKKREQDFVSLEKENEENMKRFFAVFKNRKEQSKPVLLNSPRKLKRSFLGN